MRREGVLVAGEPDIRYARTADGAYLALQVVGEGPHDVVMTANTIPIDSLWENPELADAVHRLATFARVVVFDPRGFGASDALPHDRALTAEESMADIAAVMDAAGSDRAFLFKTDNTTPAVLFASTVPDRVAGLLLFNAYARLRRAPDYPIGIPDKLISRFIEAVELNERESAFDLMCRPRSGDEAFRRWFLAAYRRGASPRAAMAIVPQDFATDSRHVLPLVQVPTLVLHTAENPYVRPAHGRYLADHIPGARYAELPGDGHNLASVDVEMVVDEVIEFVTGLPARRRTDRVFATVVFSDIVDSTALATRIGDNKWRALLDQHDALVDRQLARFSGRLIKTTGDGFVATFDGPARAVACALAVRDGLRRLDLDVRIGIHAGEVEMRGEDVSGISVHVASRVQAKARAGEILTTSTVVDLVAGSGLQFDAVEDVELKGLRGRWQLHAVGA
jgi:class 3 adenylate cyclase